MNLRKKIKKRKSLIPRRLKLSTLDCPKRICYIDERLKAVLFEEVAPPEAGPKAAVRPVTINTPIKTGS